MGVCNIAVPYSCGPADTSDKSGNYRHERPGCNQGMGDAWDVQRLSIRRQSSVIGFCKEYLAGHHSDSEVCDCRAHAGHQGAGVVCPFPCYRRNCIGNILDHCNHKLHCFQGVCCYSLQGRRDRYKEHSCDWLDNRYYRSHRLVIHLFLERVSEVQRGHQGRWGVCLGNIQRLFHACMGGYQRHCKGYWQGCYFPVGCCWR